MSRRPVTPEMARIRAERSVNEARWAQDDLWWGTFVQLKPGRYLNRSICGNAAIKGDVRAMRQMEEWTAYRAMKRLTQ